MGKQTPAAPDYAGIANQQAAASKENLTQQDYANRPTQNTPFGSVNWTPTTATDPTSGQQVTKWTQDTTLPSNVQDALNSQVNTQLARSDLGNALTGRVASDLSQPFDWSNLPAMTSSGTPGQLQTSATDYTPGLQTAYNFGGAPAAPTYDTNYRDSVAQSLIERMQPQQDYARKQAETQLSNQGFKVGTEGYTRALADLGQRQSMERYNAFDTAGNEAQRMFTNQMAARQQGVGEATSQGNFNNQALGQAGQMDLANMGANNSAVGSQFGMNSQYAQQQNQLRQQAIAEQAQQRGMSLNEINALMTGQQVGMPQMPTFSQAGISQTPDLMGAAQNTYQANLNSSNASNAGIGNLFSGASGLASAFMFSDRRLKRNIRRVGTHPCGVGIYDYEVMGYRQRGVIAQELMTVRPDLVRMHESGYLTVNYGGL